MDPKIYIVGGAVRDLLLGLEPKDVDYVVVGATPQWMFDRGYKQVGADFPVFLDDKGNEWALARTERKSGRGYAGFETKFDPTITIEADLARRDLTINAMAMEYVNRDVIIDPFNGQADLKAGILRHTSEAFADDPLRVLRLARFAARYNFTVADETIVMARRVVLSGELDALSKERIWTELMKGFSEKNPEVMLDVLEVVGALRTLPLARYFGIESTSWVKKLIVTAKLIGLDSLDVKVLSGVPNLYRMNDDEAQDLKIPTKFVKMAKHREALFMFVKHFESMTSGELVERTLKLFERIRPEDFINIPPDTKEVRAAAMIEAMAADISWINAMMWLTQSAWSIKLIDFESVVQGDKSTIKTRVAKAKEDAIWKLL